MMIPAFPDFVPVSLESAGELRQVFNRLPDGVSEFSFAGLYLFRARYQYRVSFSGDALVIAGSRNGRSFFILPEQLPAPEVLARLLQDYDGWKLIPPSLLEKNRDFFSELERTQGLFPAEDRDNFDYLYHRRELADLPGKAFHKKKNRVNAFLRAHPLLHSEPLSAANLPQALDVLEDWAAHQENPDETDYRQAKEALSLSGELGLRGFLVFAGDIPAAWCLSEFSAQGTISTVHFEKARSSMPGAFQYINYAFARSLPESVLFINREQDLGDEGLRQAKLTYRPCGFVKKYTLKCK